MMKKMKRKIILSAGHGGSDPGAVSGKYIERDLAIDFREEIALALSRIEVCPVMDPNPNALKATLSWIKGRFEKDDILLDIHWNAASPTAQGTEVIIPKIYSTFEQNFAQELLNIFASYGFKSRGIKTEDKTPRKSLGWMRPVAENILIEVCFLTNKKDMENFEKNKLELASKIAELIKSKI